MSNELERGKLLFACHPIVGGKERGGFACCIKRNSYEMMVGVLIAEESMKVTLLALAMGMVKVESSGEGVESVAFGDCCAQGWQIKASRGQDVW